MSSAVLFAPGGYRFAPGVFQYSAAVVAEPGFTIERVRWRRPVSLAEGFPLMAAHLEALGRPLTALCACELRSPAPFTETGFAQFNRAYVGTLAHWGLIVDGVNPVARSNVCPEIGAPSEPGFYAFSYTVPAGTGTPPSFIIAGSGEAPEGKSNYRDHIVRRGDVSPEGLRDKAHYVLGVMEQRLGSVGCTWREVTATHVYTVHDFQSRLGPELVRRGAAPGGLTWHHARPPVVEIEFEMDVRGVAREWVR